MENISNQLKLEAYHLGLKFKKSRLNEEAIYAKLEKQNFPVNLAKEVALNVILERKKDKKENLSIYWKFGKIMMLVIALVSAILYFYTGNIAYVFGIFSVAIPHAILVHLMTTTE